MYAYKARLAFTPRHTLFAVGDAAMRRGGARCPGGMVLAVHVSRPTTYRSRDATTRFVRDRGRRGGGDRPGGRTDEYGAVVAAVHGTRYNTAQDTANATPLTPLMHATPRHATTRFVLGRGRRRGRGSPGGAHGRVRYGGGSGTRDAANVVPLAPYQLPAARDAAPPLLCTYSPRVNAGNERRLQESSTRRSGNRRGLCNRFLCSGRPRGRAVGAGVWPCSPSVGALTQRPSLSTFFHNSFF